MLDTHGLIDVHYYLVLLYIVTIIWSAQMVIGFPITTSNYTLYAPYKW